MKCLQCGQEAKPSEIYDGIQLYECKDGHRTGIIPENQSVSKTVSEETKALKVA